MSLGLSPVVAKEKRSPPANRCIVDFKNKGIELINLARIFHNPSIQNAFPKQAGTFEPPTVVYRLVDSIRTTIFNFSKFVRELDVDAFLRDNNILPCNCNSSIYADPYHKHIVSGDLRLISNNKLRKLFTKGPKYREPVSIDLQEAKVELLGCVDELVSSWSDGQGVDKRVFQDWINEVTVLIDNRIKHLEGNKVFPTIIPKLEQRSIKKALKDLHNNYVITPIDKASGNVAFICKRFYAKILIDELGLDRSPSDCRPGTYRDLPHLNSDEVVAKQKKEIKKLFKIDICKDMETLPKMYWIPKMHKQPIKARFIVAAIKCAVKPLAKAVTAVLKQFYNQIETWHRKAAYFSGVKTFWVIQNKDPVVKAIKSLNSRRNAISISTFDDFSTLYTTIPHDKLITVKDELIDFCFRGCRDSKIVITYTVRFGKSTLPSRQKTPLSGRMPMSKLRYIIY